MPLQDGYLLHGRYQIVALLGQGGFGAVYRAWDESLKRTCAIKENLESTAEAQRQFNREAVMLANLSHPNLPRVTDYFSLEGQGQYLVMDFVDGEDLESLLTRQGVVAPEVALSWIAQVADALNYLHQQDPPVLHRDIKPANVRITPQGKAMLVDFGLVKVFDPNLRTTLGARAVTPGYAPPEQYGQASTDTRSDIYALAATLYTLLTGQTPPESVQRMAGAQLPSANALNTSVPPAVGQAINQAMSLTPSQRYQSVEDFVTALRPAMTPPKPTRQVSVQTPSTIVQPKTATGPRPSSQPPAPKSNRPVIIGIVAVAACLCLIVVGGALGGGRFLFNSVNATSTAEAVAQDTAYAESTRMSLAAISTQSVRRTSTAQAATASAAAVASALADQSLTQTALVQDTATPQPAGETPTVKPTSGGQSGALFGPENGKLEHDPNDNFIEEAPAGISVRDFIAQVTFFNPYSRDTNTWDYGLFFRVAENGAHYRLVVRSSRRWFLLYDPGNGNTEQIREGLAANLNVDVDGSNEIKLEVTGDKAKFYLNGELLAELDVSKLVLPGDVSVGTGFYTGNEVDGYNTPYEGFTVWEQ